MKLNNTCSFGISLFLFTTVCLIGLLPVCAGAITEQPLQAVPSYVNPLSGQIEDIGNNPGLGQGMVENLIMKTPATLLIDAEGSVFITFRVGLVQESQDFALELLDANGASIEAVPFNIVAEDPANNTQDLQVKVPSIDAVLRVSLISIPMGREVVGFVSFAPEGEAVEIPTAPEQEVDDEAISIYENTQNEAITGVADEDRGPLLTFMAVAAGLIVLIGAGVALNAARKKKSGESV